MTSPALAINTSSGRLYRKPETKLADVGDVDSALESGLLMPSVTNVIDVLNKPFLMHWYAKRAAEDAVQVVRDHPGLIQKKPKEAIKWISGAAKRTASAAAGLGDEVHNYVEALSIGQEVPDISDPKVLDYVAQWEKFVADYSPKFLFAEGTIFGTTGDHGKAYAGTADFIAEINGKIVVGDYKTGKSIHAEAALQLSALKHGTEIAGEKGTQAIPDITQEIVVHLGPTGYKVYETQDSDTAFHNFSLLREIWDFQRSVQETEGVWGFAELDGAVSA